MSKGRVRCVAVALLVLFVSFYFSATLCWHVHIINGATIVHSHIHAPSHHSSSDGGHTGGQITLIAALDSAVSDIIVPACVAALCLPLLLVSLTAAPVERTYSAIHLCSSLRAPPVL